MTEEKLIPCLLDTSENIYTQNKHNSFNLLWIRACLGALEVGPWSETYQCSAFFLALGFLLDNFLQPGQVSLVAKEDRWFFEDPPDCWRGHMRKSACFKLVEFISPSLHPLCNRTTYLLCPEIQCLKQGGMNMDPSLKVVSEVHGSNWSYICWPCVLVWGSGNPQLHYLTSAMNTAFFFFQLGCFYDGSCYPSY